MAAAETAVAVYDEAMLAQLAALTNSTDALTGGGPDYLKINYDEESVYPRGVWVLGQKKKDNTITEEGVIVSKVIILMARYRYSYYHEKTKEYVNTQMFQAGEQPRDKAEADAKVAALGGSLKFQTVVFGLALTEEGFKDFVSYMGGVSYVPLKNHLTDVSMIITPTKKLGPFPLFTHVTILGPTVKGKNGTITYYTPTFEVGPISTKEQIEFYDSKRTEAYGWAEQQNASSSERKAAPPAAPPASAIYTPPPAAKPHADISTMKSATTTVGEEAPMDFSSSAEDSDSYDIEAAMAAIIGAKK